MNLSSSIIKLYKVKYYQYFGSRQDMFQQHGGAHIQNGADGCGKK